MRKWRWLLGATILALFPTAGWWLFRTSAPELRFETRAYVWQGAWTPQVGAAVARAASRMDGYSVLIGEVNGLVTPLRLLPASVDWQALAKAGKPVTLTLRANRGLLDGRSVDAATQFLHDTLRKTIESARAAGIAIEGIQLDYDCPTARLPAYADLAKALRKRLPETPLSITALPSWLDSKAFKTLARQTAYYVLQVHSLDKPTTADAPVVLFDAKKLTARLKLASKLKSPYFVALPTYGYRIAFDTAGQFAGLGAENSSPTPGAKTAMANPEEMAKIVADLRTQKPPWCRGIVWFRLPVDGDTLNWSWPTLESVIDGKPPQTLPSVELRHPKDNLYEIWITNTAGYAPGKAVAIVLRLDGTNLQAWDVLGDFEGEPDRNAGTMVIRGPNPAGDKAEMVAWLRVANETQGALNVESVEWAFRLHSSNTSPTLGTSPIE